jgi:deazaflavin-dependent oxidoreductase (nitroreductase family)
MGIAADLQYSFPPPNLVQRLGQRIVSSRGGTWVMARTLPALDTALGRLSGGRQSVPGIASALPVADLTTIGRKSGLRRTTHLICIPIGDTLALVGTNFGQPSTPDWVANLEANPQASLTFRGRSVDVLARPATVAEFEEVMTTAARIFVGYARYRQRITGRRVRIFVLEAA